MKGVNKALLTVLLVPVYLTAIIILLGTAMGSIRWGYATIVLVLFVVGAWFSSYCNKIKLNTIGFVAFMTAGGYIILSSLFKPGNQKSGFEYLEIIMGAIIILFGLVPLLYHIEKRRKGNKETS